MNYQDVIKDSKFYVPMNLNLGYLLNDTEIVVLMNIINCDTIGEKLSVRKLMRYTNKNSNRKMQETLTNLRNLKLIDKFKPNYETLKFVYDSLNNAKSIEERKNWCKLYLIRVQQTVPNTSTKNCTQMEYTDKEDIEKEDIYKKDLNISHNISKDEIEKKKEFETACSEEMETEFENEVGISNDDFNWDDEIKRFKARVNKTKTKEELKGISIDFHKKMNDFNFPIELEDELDGIKKAVNSKMYSLSI